MQTKQVVVIGGGAAGLMAAGQAALAGAEVTLLEKMGQPGRKIGISGKGRCNLSNTADLPDFILHFGKNGPFLRQAFSRFFNEDLLAFFTSEGLPVTVERGGRIFPASGKALDVVRCFRRWLTRLGVTLHSDCPVDDIHLTDGAVRAVQAGSRTFPARAAILATGGASYPRTGSTGDGYWLAASCGHGCTSLRPALVPLVTAKQPAGLAGLCLRNIGLQVYRDGKKKIGDFGELMFTDSGLAGPVILTCSGAVVDWLAAGARVTLAIDCKPALTADKLDERLLRDWASRAAEPLASVLRGLLPREMIPFCLAATGLDGSTATGKLSVSARQKLGAWLKHVPFTVTGHRPLAEAIVTAGGIPLSEVDPYTMQSRLTRGLYLAGEILDLQADTGGYNLQAAFSTGWLAGRSAAACKD